MEQGRQPSRVTRAAILSTLNVLLETTTVEAGPLPFCLALYFSSGHLVLVLVRKSAEAEVIPN